jgi:polysaccharide chain length determinant protein (PEP-CTERM system associated)
VSATEQPPSGSSNYFGVLRRRAAYVAVILPLVTLSAVYLAFALPPLYRSTATILLEPSSVNNNVVASTVISYSNEQIEIVEGRVLTVPTLQELVRQFDPYPKEPWLSSQQKAQRILQNTSVERVDPVTLKPEQESNAFSLHYNNPSSERAAEVAARLAQLFLTYNQRTRSQAAKEAAAFLASQAGDVTRQLRGIDDEIKQFKNQHGDALPEDMPRNQGEIDRVQHDLDTVQQEILQAEEKESLLSVQLSQTSPNLIAQTGDLTDIATVRANLAAAQQRYTPDHPEVRRLKQALQALQTQQSAVAGGGIVKGADNPQYLSTASQLESTRHSLAALNARAGRLRASMANYEELLRRTPGVEREYSEIMRRRASLLTAYQQIQDKLQNAQLAANLESKEQGERFTLLRAPLPSLLPVFPNRIGLILLGLVLGGALTAIAIAIAETTDPAIRSAADFPDDPDAPLLASIPRILNSRDVTRHRLAVISWVAAYAVVLGFVGSKIISAVVGRAS